MASSCENYVLGRSHTKWRWDSNPGRLSVKRECYPCAIPQISNLSRWALQIFFVFVLFWLLWEFEATVKILPAWQWRKKIQSRGKSFINSIQPFLLSNLDVNREITFELFFLVWSLRQQKESFLHLGLPSVFAPMFNLILNADMDEIRWTLATRWPTLTST